ncbi:MAG: N-acetylmuramoyl-L-alanine amidase [Oscillospiraceae bacterium]
MGGTKGVWHKGRVLALHSGKGKLCLIAAAVLVCAVCGGIINMGVGAAITAEASTPKTVQKPPYELHTKPPYTVAIDAGHGDTDIGAEGLIKEIQLCESTADSLCAWLCEDANYKVVRTRKTGEDPNSAERAQVATQNKADLFFSIHANCDKSTGQSHGFECFPTPPGRYYSEQSMDFAKCVAKAMQDAGHRLRGETGIRFAYYNGKSKRIVDSSDDKVRTLKSFGVVEKVFCPAVLAEQCFITNKNDVDVWASDEGCARAAHIYYKAICAYFGTVPKQM